MNKFKYTVLGLVAVVLIIAVYYRPQPATNSLDINQAINSGGMTMDAIATSGDGSIGQAPAIDQVPSNLQPAINVQ